MAKEKHEIYDEQDKRLGRLILKILGIVAIVSGLVGPFIYLLNANWGRELGTLAGGQWLALLKTLGLSILILGYFVIVLKLLG